MCVDVSIFSLVNLHFLYHLECAHTIAWKWHVSFVINKCVTTCLLCRRLSVSEMSPGCVMNIVHSKFSVMTTSVPLDPSLFILHLPYDLSSMIHPAFDCAIAGIAVRVIHVWKPTHHDKMETPLRKYRKLYGRK